MKRTNSTSANWFFFAKLFGPRTWTSPADRPSMKVTDIHHQMDLKSTCTVPKINKARPWGRPTNRYRLMPPCLKKQKGTKNKKRREKYANDPDVIACFCGMVLLADAQNNLLVEPSSQLSFCNCAMCIAARPQETIRNHDARAKPRDNPQSSAGKK